MTLDKFDAAMQKVADAISGISACVAELRRLDVEEARLRTEFAGVVREAVQEAVGQGEEDDELDYSEHEGPEQLYLVEPRSRARKGAGHGTDGSVTVREGELC